MELCIPKLNFNLSWRNLHGAMYLQKAIGKKKKEKSKKRKERKKTQFLTRDLKLFKEES